MISYGSQTSSIFMTLLVGLLAVNIQAAPAYAQTELTQRAIVLPGGYGGGLGLVKRAMGAIPISSSAQTMAVQQVARRAVGSVPDSGTLCAPVLRTGPKLQARSEPSPEPPSVPVAIELAPVPVTDVPVANELAPLVSHLHKRSPKHKTARPASPLITEEKYGRARAW